MAWLASASATAFWARGTLRAVQSMFVSAARTRSLSAMRCFSRHCQSPFTWLITSFESPKIETRSTLNRRSASQPNNNAEYSATLFVVAGSGTSHQPAHTVAPSL